MAVSGGDCNDYQELGCSACSDVYPVWTGEANYESCVLLSDFNISSL